MGREVDARHATDAVEPAARVVILGVDAADARALPELTRLLPTDGTTVHRVPAIADWSRAERDPRRNPPGALLAALGRTRGSGAPPDALATILNDAGADTDSPCHEVDSATDDPSLHRSRWWSAGAWTVTALALAVPIAGIATVLLIGGVLVASFSTLAAIAATSLFVGFGLARQAVAIRRQDAAVASLIATDLSEDDDHVRVVVPARNAAGVAAALRERGIDAEARRIPSGDAPDPGA